MRYTPLGFAKNFEGLGKDWIEFWWKWREKEVLINLIWMSFNLKCFYLFN